MRAAKKPIAGLPGIIALGFALFQCSAKADIVRYTASPGAYPAVASGLIQEFGTNRFPPNTETVLPYYEVPGTGTVSLTFRFHADTGSFLFNFGLYRYTPELGAIDLSTTTGKTVYATQALAPGNASLLFDDRFDDPGISRVVNVNGGDLLGFFLIPDATLLQFQTNQSAFAVNGVGSVTLGRPGPNRWPLFGVAEANPDERDQLMSFAGTSAATGRPSSLFAWEDLTRATIPGNPNPSDNAFNDLIFGVEGISAIGVSSLVASDSFAYGPGEVAGRNGGSGFSGAYSGVGTVNNGSLTHTDANGLKLRTNGNRFTTASNQAVFRDLSTHGQPSGVLDANGKFGANGAVIYVGFLIRLASGGTNVGFGGLSLFDGATERIFFGDPGWTYSTWGADPQQGSNNVRASTIPVSGTTRLLVARLDFSAGNTETVRLYVDPPLTAEPATPTVGPFTVPDFRFTRLRMASSTTGAGTHDIDELRLGTTYRDVTPLAPEPHITRHPAGTNVVVGQRATFGVVAGGLLPLSYQWRLNGVPLPEATGQLLTLLNVQASDAGNYTVRVSNSFGSITSAVAVLQVSVPLYVGTRGGGTVLRSPDLPHYLLGSTVNLTATPNRYYTFLGWSDGLTNSSRSVLAGAINPLFAVFTNTVPLDELVFRHWERVLGGTNDDGVYVIQPIEQEGYVLGGYSFSGISGNKTAPHYGGADFWVLRLDASGRTEWERTYGGDDEEAAYALRSTTDGGFIVGGYSFSDINGTKTSANFGAADMWLVKLDGDGHTQWERSYGGAEIDNVEALLQTSDGGFLLVGESDSPPGGNKTAVHYNDFDFWIVKVDGLGAKEWERSYGGTAADIPLAVMTTPEGGYLVCGQSASGISGNKSAPGRGGRDIWIIKLDSGGIKLWERTFGGTNHDTCLSFERANDGGYVLGGASLSGISGNKTTSNAGDYDYWVVRIDSDGNKISEQVFGGTGFDFQTALRQTPDGGHILGGHSDSDRYGNKTAPNWGGTDYWLVRLDPYGTPRWDLTLGGGANEFSYTFEITSDGGFIQGGESASGVSGNKTLPGFGRFDAWIVKSLTRETPVGTPAILINGQYRPEQAVAVIGSATISIQTTFSDGVIFYTLNGAPPGTGRPYTGPFLLSQSATVRAVAYTADYAASAEAEPIHISIVSPPVITVQPQDRTALLGGQALLEVQAEGTEPLSYQWFFDGQALIGRTNAMLVLGNLALSQAGGYFVMVNNTYGAVTSAVAALRVLRLPAITAQPVSTNLQPGDAVMLCVTATGTEPLRYQWRLNGTILVGETNQCLNLTNVQVTGGGIFTAVVANDAAVVSTEPAFVTVSAPTVFPGDFFVERVLISGASGVLKATNSLATREAGEPLHAGKIGSNSVWYRWIAPATGIATFRTSGSVFDTLLAIYTGSTVSNLTLAASDEDQGGFYTSAVQFNAVQNTEYQIAIDGLLGQGGRFSLTWELEPTVEMVPRIIVQPSNQVVRLGASNVTFVVVAQGLSLSYQWLLNGVLIAGATNATLLLTNAQPAALGSYLVQVSSERVRTVVSQPAVLEIGGDSRVPSQDKLEDLFFSLPSGGELFAGSPKRSSASLAAGSGGFISVSVGTSDFRMWNNTDDAGQQCERDHCDVQGGHSRWLRLRPAGNATLVLDSLGSGIDTVLAVYTNASLQCASYVEVECDDNNGPDGVSGLVRLAAVQGVDYSIAVDGVNGAQGLVTMNWALGVEPVLAAVSGPQVVQAGETVELSVMVGAANPAPSYQWWHNGGLMAGETQPNLSLSNVDAGKGGTYQVVVSNIVGRVVSPEILVTVVTPLELDFLAERVEQTLQLRVLGQAPEAVALQATTNFLNWIPLLTNPLPAAPFEFVDPQATIFPFRFYRLVPWP